MMTIWGVVLHKPANNHVSVAIQYFICKPRPVVTSNWAYQYPFFVSSSNFSPFISFIGGTSTPLNSVESPERASLFGDPAAAPASTGAAFVSDRTSSTVLSWCCGSPAGVARPCDKKRKERNVRGMNERIVADDTGATVALIRPVRPNQALEVGTLLDGFCLRMYIIKDVKESSQTI